MKRRLSLGLTALASATLLGLSGCGLEPAASFVPEIGPGSIQPIPGAEDAEPVVVTSKPFTEQLILGKIAVLATEAAGYEVTDLTNVPGSQPARNLIQSGGADMFYEYTGTAWLTYLGQQEPIADQQEMWDSVVELDAPNGVTWGAPLPLNNTYAMAVRTEDVEALGGITKLSEIQDLPVEERTFCVEAEFNSRGDGLTPMLEHYGIERGAPDGVPEDQIGLYDTGAIYAATDEGACTFGEVFTTDGRIDALDLTVLEDDLGFFPAYNAAPSMNTERLANHPELMAVYESYGDLLTDEVMRTLNLRVDVEGEEPADVAFDWMVSEGLISDPEA